MIISAPSVWMILLKYYIKYGKKLGVSVPYGCARSRAGAAGGFTGGCADSRIFMSSDGFTDRLWRIRRPVNIKGQFMAPEDMRNVVDKIHATETDRWR